MAWRWDSRARAYRDGATGRFMSKDRALSLIDKSMATSGDRVGDLSRLIANGEISPADWVERMRAEIKKEYIRQYSFGRGGLENMTTRDYRSIGGMLKEQYGYLGRFADEIAAGNLTEGQIATRARMYIDSAREAYERANARAKGVPTSQLPTFPGGGRTACLTRCRCNWEFVEVYDQNGVLVAWDCYWRLDPAAEHCSDCLANAGTWNPLRIEL